MPVLLSCKSISISATMSAFYKIFYQDSWLVGPHLNPRNLYCGWKSRKFSLFRLLLCLGLEMINPLTSTNCFWNISGFVLKYQICPKRVSLEKNSLWSHCAKVNRSSLWITVNALGIFLCQENTQVSIIWQGKYWQEPKFDT